MNNPDSIFLFPKCTVNHLSTQPSDHGRGTVGFLDLKDIMEKQFGPSMLASLYTTNGQIYRVCRKTRGKETEFEVLINPPQSMVFLIMDVIEENGSDPLTVFSLLCTKNKYLAHEPGGMHEVLSCLCNSGLFTVVPCDGKGPSDPFTHIFRPKFKRHVVHWHHHNLQDVSKQHTIVDQDNCCGCFDPPVADCILPDGTKGHSACETTVPYCSSPSGEIIFPHGINNHKRKTVRDGATSPHCPLPMTVDPVTSRVVLTCDGATSPRCPSPEPANQPAPPVDNVDIEEEEEDDGGVMDSLNVIVKDSSSTSGQDTDGVLLLPDCSRFLGMSSSTLINNSTIGGKTSTPNRQKHVPLESLVSTVAGSPSPPPLGCSSLHRVSSPSPPMPSSSTPSPPCPTPLVRGSKTRIPIGRSKARTPSASVTPSTSAHAPPALPPKVRGPSSGNETQNASHCSGFTGRLQTKPMASIPHPLTTRRRSQATTSSRPKGPFDNIWTLSGRYERFPYPYQPQSPSVRGRTPPPPLPSDCIVLSSDTDSSTDEVEPPAPVPKRKPKRHVPKTSLDRTYYPHHSTKPPPYCPVDPFGPKPCSPRKPRHCYGPGYFYVPGTTESGSSSSGGMSGGGFYTPPNCDYPTTPVNRHQACSGERGKKPKKKSPNLKQAILKKLFN